MIGSSGQKDSFENQISFHRSNFRRDLKIANFYDLLEAFKNHEGQGSPSYAAAQQIEVQAKTSEAGFALLLATTAPNIFRVGPLLFPRKIRSLMPREDDDDDEKRTKLLFFEQVLDKLVVNSPWSLGFSTVGLLVQIFHVDDSVEVMLDNFSWYMRPPKAVQSDILAWRPLFSA